MSVSFDFPQRLPHEVGQSIHTRFIVERTVADACNFSRYSSGASARPGNGNSGLAGVVTPVV